MRKTNIGKLSKRIIVQAAVIAADNAGGFIEGPWQDAVTIWAEAKPGRSMRVLDMDQTRINCDVIFRVRTRAIGKNNRILYDGRACVIEGIKDWDQDREFQFIECRYLELGTSISGSPGPIPSNGIINLQLTPADGLTTIQSNYLVGKNLLSLSRNGIGLMRVAVSPSGNQFSFNDTTGELLLGLATSASEYFNVIYY
jgi:SPP1 family predicted phage head-tail adaptor